MNLLKFIFAIAYIMGFAVSDAFYATNQFACDFSRAWASTAH